MYENNKKVSVLNDSFPNFKMLHHFKCSLPYKIQRLRVRRMNFMRLKFNFSWDQIHEIKFFGTFHEVKIPNNWLDLLIVAFFMRSKFKKSIIRQFWPHDWFVSCKLVQSWDQNSKSIISNFNLMIDLLVASMIMRSKFKINYLNLVSCTCG